MRCPHWSALPAQGPTNAACNVSTPFWCLHASQCARRGAACTRRESPRSPHGRASAGHSSPAPPAAPGDPLTTDLPGPASPPRAHARVARLPCRRGLSVQAVLNVPGVDTDDVRRRLSRQFRKHKLEILEQTFLTSHARPPASPVDPQQAVQQGSSSDGPAPLAQQGLVASAPSAAAAGLAPDVLAARPLGVAAAAAATARDRDGRRSPPQRSQDRALTAAIKACDSWQALRQLVDRWVRAGRSSCWGAFVGVACRTLRAAAAQPAALHCAPPGVHCAIIKKQLHHGRHGAVAPGGPGGWVRGRAPAPRGARTHNAPPRTRPQAPRAGPPEPRPRGSRPGAHRPAD